MAKGNTDKQERNDIYTAFVVLSLFLLFGFFIYRSSGTPIEEQNIWVDQPEMPSGYQGYPYPHDDKSIERSDITEQLAPLPGRSIKPVDAGRPAVNSVNLNNVNTKASSAEPVSPIGEREIVIESPSRNMNKDKTVTAAVPEAVAPVIEKVVNVPSVEPAPKTSAVEEQPRVVAKPLPSKPVSKPKVVKDVSGMNYITSNLPCVWVVGIFKNSGNVNRVVARLRLNSFDVATGAHEKGTYVGVPCACSKDESKQDQLREIFAAQPWLLRK